MALDFETNERPRTRMRKSDRRKLILQDLKLRPHVRVSELARQFDVSTETIRRDMDALSKKGLVDRSHGGATAPFHGRYPDFKERNLDRVEERERIGKAAASMVQPGSTIMIDSGSTTVRLAQFLALNGTACTVITNSLVVAQALGQNEKAGVILCPGDYLPAEGAVVGTDTIRFLKQYQVDACFLGASGLSKEGPSETIRSFASIKSSMLELSKKGYLLVDREKFGNTGLVKFGALQDISVLVTDELPSSALSGALQEAGVSVEVAS